MTATSNDMIGCADEACGHDWRQNECALRKWAAGNELAVIHHAKTHPAKMPLPATPETKAPPPPVEVQDFVHRASLGEEFVMRQVMVRLEDDLRENVEAAGGDPDTGTVTVVLGPQSPEDFELNTMPVTVGWRPEKIAVPAAPETLAGAALEVAR